jgi:hypothetical protein
VLVPVDVDVVVLVDVVAEEDVLVDVVVSEASVVPDEAVSLPPCPDPTTLGPHAATATTSPHAHHLILQFYRTRIGRLVAMHASAGYGAGVRSRRLATS